MPNQHLRRLCLEIAGGVTAPRSWLLFTWFFHTSKIKDKAWGLEEACAFVRISIASSNKITQQTISCGPSNVMLCLCTSRKLQTLIKLFASVISCLVVLNISGILKVFWKIAVLKRNKIPRETHRAESIFSKFLVSKSIVHVIKHANFQLCRARPDGVAYKNCEMTAII